MKSMMLLSDSRLPAVFAGTFVVAYVIWKFIHDTRKRGSNHPPSLWSLPLIGSMLFLPDFRIWHREFLRMSTRIGNVFAFYLGSRYVLCILFSTLCDLKQINKFRLFAICSLVKWLFVSLCIKSQKWLFTRLRTVM